MASIGGRPDWLRTSHSDCFYHCWAFVPYGRQSVPLRTIVRRAPYGCPELYGSMMSVTGLGSPVSLVGHDDGEAVLDHVRLATDV